MVGTALARKLTQLGGDDMSVLNRVVLLGLLVLSLGVVPSFADTLFFDGTFNLANYSFVAYKSDPAATITFQQITSGGNPGKALQININLPLLQSSFLTMQGFVNNTFVYNPSVQGKILGINASADKLFASNPFFNLNSSFFRPLIFQDGNYYLAAISLSTTQNIYNHGSANNLQALDFQLFNFLTGTFNPALHPNFSGDSMKFGLASRITANPGYAGLVTNNYDNLSLGVTATPEPASLLLVGCGFLALALCSRKLLGT
jgi:hypothetical protein